MTPPVLNLRRRAVERNARKAERAARRCPDLESLVATRPMAEGLVEGLVGGLPVGGGLGGGGAALLVFLGLSLTQASVLAG